jgi:hypothetical protein
MMKSFAIFTTLLAMATAFAIVPNGGPYTLFTETIPGTTDQANGFTVAIETNAIVNQDVLSVTLPGSGGYSFTFTNSNLLRVTGPSATIGTYTAILNTVKFQTTATSELARTISWSYSYPGSGSAVFSQATGHYYEAIQRGNGPFVDWATAKTLCEGRTVQGRQGYLVTITSAAEQSFVETIIRSVGWIGASDRASEGQWKWVTGPETGTLFTQCPSSNWYSAAGCEYTFGYVHWANGEPNEYGGEDYAHVYASGWWNDYNENNQDVSSYLCEYGGMPNENASPFTASGSNQVKYTSVPPDTLVCTDLHYWIEEGLRLDGNLLLPPAINTDFNDKMYANLPNAQNGPSGCSSAPIQFPSFSIPAHYTQSPPGYTPVIGPFSVESSTGRFSYISAVTKSNPVVWNGYDSFTWTARCGSNGPTCTKTAFVNVIFTKAATQNSQRISFTEGYNSNTIRCSGSCRNGADGMWMARHTLPRLWDMQRDEKGQLVKNKISYGGVSNIDTDGLDFEWSSNFALISTYGAISNMAVRFPTFEVVQFNPGTSFDQASVASQAASLSTGFDASCLNIQNRNDDSTARDISVDRGTDVWVFNTDQADGQVGTKSSSGKSWYQKFGGRHYSCDIFQAVIENNVRRPCRYAPLLTPRLNQDEDLGGVWKFAVEGCAYKWQGKFTWNAMRTQKLFNGNDAMHISGGGNAAYTITGEIYNQAVQPNSWTDPSRGFVEIDHKYLLTVVLSQDTNFQFELGIDIFTVDLQQFRYFVGNEHAFGFNMIVYPKKMNDITPQSDPDRRVTGFQWVEHKWIAPGVAECTGMQCGQNVAAPGRFSSVDSNGNYQATSGQAACANSATAAGDYTGATFPSGNCDVGANPAVYLYKGPATPAGTSVCTNGADPMTDIRGVSGISPQNAGYPASPVTCSNNYQNITLRGRAPGSDRNQGNGAFGFEGKITLTFQLANGEHPHFVITPQMYVKSISIDGAFAGTTSTCRSSPYWPIPDATGTSLPQYLCEEVDARTFGPTDWAVIFFDIKDIDEQLVTMTKLSIQVNSLTIKFYPLGDNTLPGTDWNVQYTYLNFRDLKNSATLSSPSASPGVVPPKKTDYAFAFTPGAHNENAKITIYCTLRIKSSAALKHSARRFASSEAAPESENTVQERISINRGVNPQVSSLSSNQRVVEGSSDASANNGSSSAGATVIVLAAACAVLLAAVIGMVLYVVRQHSTAAKRVGSSA